MDDWLQKPNYSGQQESNQLKGQAYEMVMQRIWLNADLKLNS